jgi:hypothetical protein
MVGDKVEFCGELGIEIAPDMWPSGLFETALSDNGALIAHLFEHFRKSLRLNFDVIIARISSTPFPIQSP